MPSDPVPADLLARLHGLHPKRIDLTLDRLRALLGRLGNPERRLPPTLHVAGTNGKGSTCAFLRAIAEAAGLRTHVFTSPHLVRFEERIRLAGALVRPAALKAALDTVEAANDGAPITVFELITAAALHLFAETPADLLVLEVGLGGRGDATNVVPHKRVTAVTAISLDHQEFLGDTLALIAAEKAGIFAPATPAITGRQPPEVLAVLDEAASRLGVRLAARDRDWTIAPGFYADGAGTLAIPALGLLGAHQWDNAGIAIATLRAAGLTLPDAAFTAGAARAHWPARLQRLAGSLAALLPKGCELWLDGGHNPGGAAALAEILAGWTDRPTDLVIGMKQTKDPAGFLVPLLAHARTVFAVSEPDQHLALPPAQILAASGGRGKAGPDLAGALGQIPAGPARVLICGSLHLAGVVLAKDGTLPD